MNEEIKRVEGADALIPIFNGVMSGQRVRLCNARDLHTFLQVGKDFSNWIKDRLETYGFTEGEDYSPNLANRSGGTAGKRRIDYHLTLDTAKELAMVEKNEQGKLARRYFIECEKRLLKNPNQLPREIEKACDYTSWKVSGEYQQASMCLIGNAVRENDDEVIGHVSFLIKRRIFDELVKVAQDMLSKKVPEHEVSEWILTWKQAERSGLRLC